MVGMNDIDAAEHVRAECHGMHFEEVAPALAESGNLSESIWGIAVTSTRLPSYHHPKIITTNMPGDDHWSWQRFFVRRDAGTAFVRIPAGESASAEDRAEWAESLKNRPDLLRRLIAGMPGTLQIGEQVAVGFNADDHVLYGPAPKVDRYARLWLGTDGGESHTWVTVVGQRVKDANVAKIRIHAALLSSPSGARQHMKDTVIPWLSEHAPWALQGEGAPEHRYDPACDTEDPGDAESNPLRTMRAVLPGSYRPGPVSWAGRRDPLLATLRSRDPVLEIAAAGSGNAGLIRALTGGWHYPTDQLGRVTRDKPKKPNHPHEDYGDGLCYLIAGMAPLAEERGVMRVERAIVAASAWDTEARVETARGSVSAWE